MERDGERERDRERKRGREREREYAQFAQLAMTAVKPSL